RLVCRGKAGEWVWLDATSLAPSPPTPLPRGERGARVAAPRFPFSSRGRRWAFAQAKGRMRGRDASQETRVTRIMPAKAVIIAAPRSGSGKTAITLGIARALAGRGVSVAPAKTGPDYIDPAFLAAAAGSPAVDLGPSTISPDTLSTPAA